MNKDYSYMEQTLHLAQTVKTDIPVAAIIVKNHKIIAQGTNSKEINQDITAHAEIIALKHASIKLQDWRLTDCTLYVNLEPCPMCAAAILFSRIQRVVFGAYDTLYGAFESTLNMKTIIHSSTEVVGGILEKSCQHHLQDFFQKLR